jgi:hypothetical protein
MVMNIKPIDQINGIKVGNPEALQHLKSAVELACSLSTSFGVQGEGLNRVAAFSAVHAVNALLAAAKAQCTLALPPADIDMRPDSSGALIYCCEHPKSHKWKLDGSPL